MSPTLFVVGATGTQGGALVRAIQSLNKNQPQDPITVHALVRSTSTIPEDLANDPNIKFVTGNFDDVSSIKAAASSCDAAFINVTPVFTDLSGEARHARHLVEACASVSTLKRVIYSSSAAMHRSADDNVWSEFVEKYPEQWVSIYMKSKKDCEDAVINSSNKDFSEGWSIIRSNTYLTNFLTPWTKFMYPDLESKQTITTANDPDLPISFMDPNDLGPLMAQMMICETEVWNEKWKGKFVPVATEHMTLGQLVGKMNAALKSAGTEKQIELIQIGEEDAKARANQGDLIAATQIFQNNYQRAMNLDEVRSFGIEVEKMVTADEFFQRNAQRLVQTVGGA